MLEVRFYIFNIRILILLVVLYSVSGAVDPAFAAENGAIMLDPVIVTAKEADDSYRTGDVDTETTPVFFSKIQRSEFEGKMESLSEVIEKQAGIQVRQSGGLGSFSSVSLRGASAEQVLVYLDGVLLNDASGGGVDLSNIALSDVESIEIYKGMTPINFDKASVGGVVNIKTIRAASGLNANLLAGYGSFDTRKFSGFLNYKPGRTDYLVSADYLSSENDFRIKNDNGTPKNPADDRWEDRNNAQFDQQNVLARMGADLTPDWRVDFTNKWFNKDQGLPSWNNSPLTDTTYDTEQNITTLGMNVNRITPLRLNTHTQIDYLIKTEEYDDSNGRIGLGRQKSRYDTRRLGGEFFTEWASAFNTVQFTLGAQRETFESKDLLAGKETTESRRNLYTAGIQDTMFLMDGRLSLTPGLRYKLIDDTLVYSSNIIDAAGEGADRNEDYLTPQVGLKYRLTDAITVKSNLARYVREPSFFELFGDRGIFVGNPDLQSEEGTNFDAGFAIDQAFSDRFINRVRFQSAFFVSRIDNLITRTYDARGIGKADNVSQAEIIGVENELDVDFIRNLRLICRYTWQDAQNNSDIAVFDGNQLPGRFEHSWLARLEYRLYDATFYSEYIREANMFYDTANLLEAQTQSTFNAGVSWLWQSWLLTLEADNIGGDRYEDFNGYPQPGRSFFMSLKYQFDL